VVAPAQVTIATDATTNGRAQRPRGVINSLVIMSQVSENYSSDGRAPIAISTPPRLLRLTRPHDAWPSRAADDRSAGYFPIIPKFSVLAIDAGVITRL